jgi:carbon-monoxide dehydrogenase medium subunit
MAGAEPIVLVPTSRAEALRAFDDGTDVTVFAGGTILMPELAAGRVEPRRALLLHRAGLDEVRRDGSTWTIGAAAKIAKLESMPAPLGPAAARVADLEIRGQGTIGGNLCAPPGVEAPRGDLQGPLLALDARVRSGGPGGERLDPVEQFLAGGTDGRLVLEFEVDDPRSGAYVSLGRPHAHTYTILAVSAAETQNGLRVAVFGAGPRARRCRSVEASRDTHAVFDDVEPHDDALASAWYRRQVLPRLVQRTLDQL